MILFFVFSGVIFWVLIGLLVIGTVNLYVRSTSEERSELLEAINGTEDKRHPVIKHLDAFFTCMVLLPLVGIGMLFKGDE